MKSNTRAPRHPTGWQSYDSVAEAYERMAVPWFTPIVHDLLNAVAPRPAARVLDVGCGTGLAAGLAASIVGPGGVAVGVDPSVDMLAIARNRPSLNAVAGMAPGLPFADRSFDAVIANLVLSHLPDIPGGLADMVRVLRPGGRLGCTAWAEAEPAHRDNQQVEAAAEIDAAIRAAGLDATPAASAVPWEDHLRNVDHLVEALASAGLTAITVAKRTYRRTFTVDEYVSGWGSRSRYLQSIASVEAWDEFRRQAEADLRKRFDGRISAINHAWVATADKPSSPTADAVG